MTVYLINILLIFVWAGFLLKKEPLKKNKRTYCTIIAVQWILISGLRHWSVGNDTNVYANNFNRVKGMSWGTVISNCWDYLFNDLDIKDPGYNLLQKIFQIFSDDYQVFLIFIAILFTGLMARWIYKYSELPEISFLIYSVLFFAFYAITGHRQTIATALVVFIGYDLIKARKYFKFLIISFVAFMIHKSSLVFLLYMLIANINLNFFYVVFMSVSTAVVGLLGVRLYGPVALMLGFKEEQIEYSVGGAGTYATILLCVCVVAFILYPIIKKRNDVKYLYNMLFLTMGSTLLVFQQQGFMRIQQYYSLIIMIVIPEIIISLEKKSRSIAYICVVAVLTLYIILQNPQYKFFFM